MAPCRLIIYRSNYFFGREGAIYMIITGPISNTVKKMELEFKLQEQKSDISSSKEEEEDCSIIAEMNRRVEDSRKRQKILSVEMKLKKGASLSAGELEDLKRNNPELYEKAVRIEKERESYRYQLRKAGTKEDVKMLHTQKVQLLNAEARSIGGHSNIQGPKKGDHIEEIGMRTAAAASEYNEYKGSARYAGLPENHKEIKKGQGRKLYG